MYLFSKKNCFRILMWKLYKHPWWERIIMTIILLSSLKLGVDTYDYTWAENQVVLDTMKYLDDIFNYIFIVELSVKVVAMGFCMDRGSYIRDSWNQLDGFIVFTSVIDMALS